MVKKLIINADDFGMTEGVTKGIIDCYADGVLTSTTLLMNMKYTKFAIEEAKKHPLLGVGIHLALTIGRPIIEGAKSFTDSKGDFLPLTFYSNLESNIDPEELYVEWRAQIEKFIELAGKLPTHIDSHHHIHMIPAHRDVVIRLTKEYDLPVRQSEEILNTYERVMSVVDFYGDDLNLNIITDELQADSEIMEIVCHPAYLDQEVYNNSSYNIPRMKEMEILRSAELREFIEANKIELITFADVKKLV